MMYKLHPHLDDSMKYYLQESEMKLEYSLTPRMPQHRQNSNRTVQSQKIKEMGQFLLYQKLIYLLLVHLYIPQ